jgi:hypothetical protein
MRNWQILVNQMSKYLQDILSERLQSMIFLIATLSNSIFRSIKINNNYTWDWYQYWWSSCCWASWKDNPWDASHPHGVLLTISAIPVKPTFTSIKTHPHATPAQRGIILPMDLMLPIVSLAIPTVVPVTVIHGVLPA